MNLDDTVRNISDRHSFAQFVSALRADFRAHPENLQNATVDDFLEALSGYATDIDGLYANRGETLPDQPTWRMVGELLYGAAIYD